MSFDLKDVRQKIEKHLSEISDEEFEKELIEAGIEKCPLEKNFNQEEKNVEDIIEMMDDAITLKKRLDKYNKKEEIDPDPCNMCGSQRCYPEYCNSYRKAKELNPDYKE